MLPTSAYTSHALLLCNDGFPAWAGCPSQVEKHESASRVTIGLPIGMPRPRLPRIQSSSELDAAAEARLPRRLDKDGPRDQIERGEPDALEHSGLVLRLAARPAPGHQLAKLGDVVAVDRPGADRGGDVARAVDRKSVV